MSFLLYTILICVRSAKIVNNARAFYFSFIFHTVNLQRGVFLRVKEEKR